ncbi:MAG: transcriptional repressor NrdR [Chloroflexi bacterium]|nr:transcriptional repressor NrdR [Chloroflexota bacterium]
MKCPYCSSPDSKVVDSRDVEDAVRRRRECLRCGLRFTTYERVQTTAMMVVKRDGRREEFNREKLKGGILRACAKRPVPLEAIEKLVLDIEGRVQGLGRAEVPSSLIGELVMERLRELDHVAYVRFASVYRNFQDIESFKQTVDTLLGARGDAQPAKPPQHQLPLPLENGGRPGARTRPKRITG